MAPTSTTLSLFNDLALPLYGLNTILNHPLSHDILAASENVVHASPENFSLSFFVCTPIKFVKLPTVVVTVDDVLLLIDNLKVALERELVEADDRSIILAVEQPDLPHHSLGSWVPHILGNEDGSMAEGLVVGPMENYEKLIEVFLIALLHHQKPDIAKDRHFLCKRESKFSHVLKE